MHTLPRTLVTVATYNEIENLPALVAEIRAVAPQADLLVIDDNSPDGTGRWVDEQSRRDPQVRAVHRPGKLGLGTATIAAMRYAIEHDYDFMLNLDADFSHPPRYIPELLGGMDDPERGPVDVTIGSRYVRGGGIEGWPLRRRLLSLAVNGYARLMLGLPVRDCSGAFRCYRVSTLRRMDLDQVRSRGYSFLEELLWRLKRAGASFRETPIVFVDRLQGTSKVNLREARDALGVLLRLGVKNWLGV